MAAIVGQLMKRRKQTGCLRCLCLAVAAIDSVLRENYRHDLKRAKL